MRPSTFLTGIEEELNDENNGGREIENNNEFDRIDWNGILTGMSFMVHVKFDAGFDLPAVQFARKLSPTLNRPRWLCIWTMGRCSGVSEEKKMATKSDENR